MRRPLMSGASEAERAAALSVALREMARRVAAIRRVATVGVGVTSRRWEAAYRQAAFEHRQALEELGRLREQRNNLLWFCEGIETQAEETGRLDLTIQDVREYLGDLSYDHYDISPAQSEME